MAMMSEGFSQGELDGTRIQADSVPDLCRKVMEFMHARGHWKRVLELAPYKTSAQRYLFSRTPQHPNGNDFFVEIKCRDVYVGPAIRKPPIGRLGYLGQLGNDQGIGNFSPCSFAHCFAMS